MKYVKICGLKLYEQVQICIDNGADAVGFIYNVPSSSRNMQKHEIIKLLEQIKDKIVTVIVIKPSNINDIKEIMDEFNVTYFQIHYNFNLKELKWLEPEKRRKIILALKLGKNNVKDIIKQIKKYQNQIFAFLIDSSEGHGNKLDLGLIKEVLKNSNKANIIVAGGIDLMNVEKIVEELKPFGIDVSSSLESKNGVKDPIKITKFLKKVKEIKNKLKSEK